MSFRGHVRSPGIWYIREAYLEEVASEMRKLKGKVIMHGPHGRMYLWTSAMFGKKGGEFCLCPPSPF